MKNFILLFALIVCSCTAGSSLKRQTDRERDGFIGKVANVYVSTIIPSDGKRCPQRSDSYDTDGRLTKHKIYAGGCGTASIATNYTYPTIDKRTSTTQGTADSTTVFSFDANGRLSDETTAFNNNESIQVQYFYDEIGRIKEKTYLTNGTPYSKEVYEYKDDQKAPLKFIFTDTKANKTRTITYTNYVFNTAGDWIQRDESDDGKLTFIERAIEYYKD
jgi:YD repeat-containing protein